jgi:hypothetical protein
MHGMLMLANYLIEDFLSLSFLYHTEFFSVNERQRNYICLSLRRISIALKRDGRGKIAYIFG